jgi:hypothetical protein
MCTRLNGFMVLICKLRMKGQFRVPFKITSATVVLLWKVWWSLRWCREECSAPHLNSVFFVLGNHDSLLFFLVQHHQHKISPPDYIVNNFDSVSHFCTVQFAYSVPSYRRLLFHVVGSVRAASPFKEILSMMFEDQGGPSCCVREVPDSNLGHDNDLSY